MPRVIERDLGVHKTRQIQKESVGKESVLLSSVALNSITILGVLFSLVYIPFSANIIAFACLIMSFLGPEKWVKSVALLIFVRFFNPALSGPLLFEIGVFHWLLLFVSAVSYSPRAIFQDYGKFIPLFLFSTMAAFLSCFTSSAFSISILKLVSFCLGSVAALSAFYLMSRAQIRSTLVWLFTLWVCVVMGSLFVFLKPSAAYYVNGTGFQGLLAHPQAFASLLSPLAAFLAGKIIFGRNGIFSVYTLVLAIVVFLQISSKGRGAFLSFVLSVVLVYLFLQMPVIQKKVKDLTSFNLKVFGIAVLVISSLVLYQPAQNIVKDFVYKRESNDIEEAFSSRSGGYTDQFQNFLDSPIVGHGFGVYPGPNPSKSVTYLMGIPISAPVEKGFVVTAVLEETGVFGGVLFVFIVVSLAKSVLRSNRPEWFCVFLACMLNNISEAVFFSTAGMGMFYWLLFGLGGVVYKLQDNEGQYFR